MKRRFPSHLRLHNDEHASRMPTSVSNPSGRESDEVDSCLRAFSEATNFSVVSRAASAEARSPQSAASVSAAAGRQWQLVDNIVRAGMLDEADLAVLPSVPMDKAQRLLQSLERLVFRLDQAEAVIRRQEAELATSVVVTSHPDRQQETADRLESILESTSRSIGAVAAAVYLLDDGTSQLKMRSCFGLPGNRLIDPPRELRGSLADLEALLGNAVLLTDIPMMREWPSPEEFASALVVPIGTSSMPHGTLWFWSDKPRSYSATEIEVANLAAGRIMGEIEQSILGHEVHKSRVVQKQIDTATLTQASMLPDRQILHEDFDLGGWTYQSEGLGGAFHHWDLVPSGLMTFALGCATQGGPQGCIVATSAQSMIKTLWNQGQTPAQILRAINDLHWSMTEADWRLSLSLIQFNPVTGYGSLCNSGEMQAFIVSSRGFRPLGAPRSIVGEQPDTLFQPSRFILQPGEVLVAHTPGLFPLANGATGANRPSILAAPSLRTGHVAAFDQARLLATVRDLCDEPASDTAAYLARLLSEAEHSQSPLHDRSMVLIRNIRKAYR